MTLYLWLQFQCTQIETAVEYRRSHNELTRFLGYKKTKDVLSTECIKAVVTLQNSLRTRESKLAGYQRNDRKCCMEACTTSPAECWNWVTKHVFKCNSRTKITNSFRKMCTGTDERIKRRQNKAKRELGKRNTASCAPTAAYINQRGQGLADRNFDHSLDFKSAQLGPNRFLAWNFGLVDKDELDDVDDFSSIRMCEFKLTFVFHPKKQ